MNKYASVLILLCNIIPSIALAGDLSNAAVPERIDIERAGGVMVYGSFGNAASCTISDRFYLKSSHPQYAQAYSAILAAFSSGKKVQVYIHICEPVTWYSSPEITYNIVDGSSVINVMK